MAVQNESLNYFYCQMTCNNDENQVVFTMRNKKQRIKNDLFCSGTFPPLILVSGRGRVLMKIEWSYFIYCCDARAVQIYCACFRSSFEQAAHISLIFSLLFLFKLKF